MLVLRWVGTKQASIITDLHTNFGALLQASGKVLFAFVRSGYIDPLVHEQSDAEDDLKRFLWSQVFAGDGSN